MKVSEGRLLGSGGGDRLLLPLLLLSSPARELRMQAACHCTCARSLRSFYEAFPAHGPCSLLGDEPHAPKQGWRVL
jgi:hypothetical protein